MSNQPIPVSEAVIVRQENIATIAQAGTQTYQSNSVSCQRCSDAGLQLLDEIERCGMSDDLDKRLAAYIEKARKTVKVMNERRSPVTKLFDQVRSEFTILENTIDPTKKDTIPYRIAQYRNAYAAKKREEEERRRQAELAAQELQRAKETYRVAVEEDYRRSFNAYVGRSVNELSALMAAVTLASYQHTATAISEYAAELSAGWYPPSSVRQPYNLSPDEAKTIRDETFARLLPSFAEQYAFEVGDYRQELLNKLPSKKVELQRVADADAAEAARLRAEMAKREAEEAARKEQERLKAEAEARQKAEMDKANAEMAGLFGAAKAGQAYAPKTKVTKKIKASDAAAFLPILSMWWQYEGCRLPVEELSKIFKKQVAFCEKLATKDGVYAEGAGIEYVDEVKAQ